MVVAARQASAPVPARPDMAHARGLIPQRLASESARIGRFHVLRLRYKTGQRKQTLPITATRSRAITEIRAGKEP